ncbi:MAG: hypothetical protein HY903_24635 [Deltaproteobacteria bacterium]|nr:hypothetical protein [Deltaproteobacteria bacterium]
MKNRSSLLLVTLLLGSFTVGCNNDESASITEIRSQSTELATSLIRDFGASLEFVASMQSVEGLTRGSDTVTNMQNRISPPPAPPAPWPGVSQSAQTSPDAGGPGATADEAAEEVRRVLEEYVFADANVEETGSDWALFRIKASTVCPKLRDEATQACTEISWGCDAYGTPSPDCLEGETQDRLDCMTRSETDFNDCMAKLDAMEIRVKVTVLDGDHNLDLELMVGPARANPIDFHLRTNSIAFDVDLAASKEALNHLASVLGEDAPGLPAAFAGVLRFSLTKNGEQDLSAAVSILQDLNIGGEYTDEVYVPCDIDPDGNEICPPPTVVTHHLDVKSAAADPLLSLRVQALEQKLTVAVDVNRTQITVPFAEVFDFGDRSGDFIVDLAGLNFQAVLQEGVEGLLLSGVGFGDSQSSVRHGSVVIAALDLNAGLGRMLDQTTTIVDGWPTFSFDPGVALDVYLNLGYLDQFNDPAGEPAPSFARDQTYSIDLTPGAAGVAQLTPFAAPTPESLNGDGIKVVAGALSAGTSADPAATVTVGEGLCLFGREALAPGAHEILGHFYAAACE